MSAREAGELEGSVRAAVPEAELAIAATPFAAGLEIGRHPPDVVIVGATPTIGASELRGLVGRASGAGARSGQRTMRVLVVEGGEAERLTSAALVTALAD